VFAARNNESTTTEGLLSLSAPFVMQNFCHIKAK